MIVTTCLVAYSAASAADNYSISSVPDRCVSLHKGQTCYQKITIHWRSPEVAKYCITATNQKTPLHCWDSSNHGKVDIDFHSPDAVTITLLRKEDKKALASTTIDIFWVYKSRRKNRGWRLF